jgi:chromosome segregation ATPase
MNIYQNTQLGGLIHKLSKYQTLLAKAPTSKLNIYESKVKSYKNQLAKIGYGNTQEGGAYQYNKDTGAFTDTTNPLAQLSAVEVVNKIQETNQKYASQSAQLGIQYNILMLKLQDVFKKFSEITAEYEAIKAKFATQTAEQTALKEEKNKLDGELAGLKTTLESLTQTKDTLEAEISGLKQQLEQLKLNAAANADKIRDLENQIALKEAQLQDLLTQINNMRLQIDDLQRKLSETEAKLAATADLLAQCEAEKAAIILERDNFSGQVTKATSAIAQLVQIENTDPAPIQLKGIDLSMTGLDTANLPPGPVKDLYEELQRELQAKSI